MGRNQFLPAGFVLVHVMTTMEADILDVCSTCCLFFPSLFCLVQRTCPPLFAAGEDEYITHIIFCQHFFLFFSKIFHFFFRFFFRGFFPHFQAHSLGGGRLLSVTGGRGGFPRHAGAGRGARRRRAHGRRMMTRGIGAARSVPRRPCRWRWTCPQPERTAMQSGGLPCPAGWPRHGRRGMEPDGGTAQSPEHAGSRHI